jgi:hypothetical protein
VRDGTVDRRAYRGLISKVEHEPRALTDAAPLLALHHAEDIGDGPSRKQLFPGEQRVRGGGEREDVGGRPDLLVLHQDLLWRGVSGGAQAAVQEGLLQPLRTRHAKVRNLEQLTSAGATAQDVTRLDVAMDDPHLVDGSDAAG